MCQIIWLDKQDLLQSSIALQQYSVHYNLLIKAHSSNHLIIKMPAVLVVSQYMGLIMANIRYGKNNDEKKIILMGVTH